LSQIAQELGIASSRLRAWRNRDEGVRAGSPLEGIKRFQLRM
jgi:transposase-like protein